MKSTNLNRCINNPVFSKHVNSEQMREMGRLGAKARELIRLDSEPDIYMPNSNVVTHAFLAVNMQYDGFYVTDAMVLLNKPNRRFDSYHAIINGKMQSGFGGVARWQEKQRKALQVRFLNG